MRGKSPFQVLMRDLQEEIEALTTGGYGVIVGGDFNQDPSRGGAGWRQLEAWAGRCGLVDGCATCVSAGACQCEWARSLVGRERPDARAMRWGAQRRAKRAERLFACRSVSLRK